MKKSMLAGYLGGVLGLAGALPNPRGLPWFNVPFLPRARRAKRCLLKSCGRIHSHNNSWCSAEHCRQWRAENPYNGKGRP